MRFDDLAHDVEAQAQAARPALLLLAHAKRIEQVRHHRGWDRSPTLHGDHHLVAPGPVEPHRNRRVLAAVLQRVADQVGQHLEQPVLVPEAQRLALVAERDAARSVGDLVIGDDAATQRQQIRLVRRQRETTAGHARARQVEQLLDHAPHALAAGQDPRRRPAQRFVGRPARQGLRAGGDHAQRVAQVVAQHRREHLRHAQALGQLAHQALALGGAGLQGLHRLRQLAPLAKEAQEHVDLLAQDRQLQRFEEKVDRAGAVALERAQLILGSGSDEDDRHLARAQHAAHQLGQLEAVHLRHLHVEQRQRDVVVHQQQLQRVASRLRLDHLEVVAAQERLQRATILLEIVDNQDLGARRATDCPGLAGVERCAGHESLL